MANNLFKNFWGKAVVLAVSTYVAVIGFFGSGQSALAQTSPPPDGIPTTPKEVVVVNSETIESRQAPKLDILKISVAANPDVLSASIPKSLEQNSTQKETSVAALAKPVPDVTTPVADAGNQFITQQPDNNYIDGIIKQETRVQDLIIAIEAAEPSQMDTDKAKVGAPIVPDTLTDLILTLAERVPTGNSNRPMAADSTNPIISLRPLEITAEQRARTIVDVARSITQGSFLEFNAGSLTNPFRTATVTVTFNTKTSIGDFGAQSTFSADKPLALVYSLAYTNGNFGAVGTQVAGGDGYIKAGYVSDPKVTTAVDPERNAAMLKRSAEIIDGYAKTLKNNAGTYTITAQEILPANPTFRCVRGETLEKSLSYCLFQAGINPDKETINDLADAIYARFETVGAIAFEDGKLLVKGQQRKNTTKELSIFTTLEQVKQAGRSF
ncbi:MAG: hypothetical protein ACK5XX_03485 [Holosporales bacterium]